MNEKYIPLYRKYRPQRIEEIVGQEHIKKALTNAISMGRISHAYLFTGPRGTGKTSTARIFAKSLNCVDGPTIKPCGTCENCVNITNSVPMDVIEIDAASNRKVEDAQNILEKVMYAPVNSRYKIYIIDEVHMLSTTAFNALLKTLEEPPKNVIFILATTEVHKVLDTIKSRCQRFDFKRITTQDIVKHLRFISDNEKINITDDALFSIAKNSAGGMRDSIALLDQLSILNSEEAISTDDINKLLGRISFDTLNKLSNGIIESKPEDAIETLENIYNSGNEPVQILTNLLDYFKNLLIVKNCRAEIIFELTQLNEVQLKELKLQADKLETHQISYIIDKIANYIKEIKTTNNPRLWLEVGVIDLANLAENTTLMELQNRLARLEGGVVNEVKPQPVIISKPKQQPQQPQPQPDEKSTAEIKNEVEPEKEVKVEEDFAPMPKAQTVVNSSNDIGVLWGDLISNISSPPTRALLKQWANPVKISADETILTMKNEIFLNQVNGAKKGIIVDALNKLFSQDNSNLTLRLPLPEDTQVKISSQEKQSQKKNEPVKINEPVPDDEEIEQIIAKSSEAEQTKLKKYDKMHSDMVNMVIDVFDGKIID